MIFFNFPLIITSLTFVNATSRAIFTSFSHIIFFLLTLFYYLCLIDY